MDLTLQKCAPCEGGVKPYGPEDIKKRLADLTTEWEVVNNHSIRREFKFNDFKEAMVFINKVAELAEHEGHHPDIHCFWNKVILELWTHAIDGLSINDFIMARKIEEIEPERSV